MADPAQNKPPQTIPVKVQLSKGGDDPNIVLYMQVLPDNISRKAMKGAETRFVTVGLIPNPKGQPFICTTPGYTIRTEGSGRTAKQFVDKLNGSAQIKVLVQIQTTYGAQAKPADASAYGRGTTADDEKAGDTSLGFHESCHQSNYRKYLEGQNLPGFGGMPGMTVEQYKKEAQAFSEAVQAYFKKMGEASAKSTDDVGYTQSEFQAKGPRH